MLAKLEQSAATLSETELRRTKHALVVLPPTDTLDSLRGTPGLDALSAALARRKKKLSDLAKTPVATEWEAGTLVAWVMLDPLRAVFERQTLLRKGVQLLLAEKPESISIAVNGPVARRREAAEQAVYAAWVNGARLPERRKKTESADLQTVRLYGYRSPDGCARQRAVAAANLLCRELTVLPPNELTRAR